MTVAPAPDTAQVVVVHQGKKSAYDRERYIKRKASSIAIGRPTTAQKRAAIDIDDAQLRRMDITNPPDEAVEIAFLKARLNPWIVIVCGPGHPPKDILNCPGNRDFDKVVRLSRRSYQHGTKAQRKVIRDLLIGRFQFLVWNDPTRSYIPFYKETEQKTRAALQDKALKALAKSYTPNPNVTER